MDYFEGVKVEVTSNGQTLPLYDDPDAPDDHNPRERQRYIEATTGAKFAIKVTLTKNFHFGDSQVARVCIAFDGDPNYRFVVLKKDSWLVSGNVSYLFAHFTIFCPASSTWKQKDFMFGSLDITESTNIRINSAQLKALGEIKLTIERMNLQYLKNPYSPPKRQVTRVAQVSEKTLKGSAISSTVSYTDGKRVAQPADIKHLCMKIPGRLGEPVDFKILYRSKPTLQMLGCLPRTPSPEAVPAPSISNPTEATSHNSNISGGPKDRDKEIRDLRARLALLEGDETVKSESSHTAGEVKRERREDNQSHKSSKRSRKSGPVETVDLTAD